MGSRIRYLGTYTKVPIVHSAVEPHEWLSLPVAFQRVWLNRILTSQGMRAVHARVSIRKECPSGPPPSVDAINRWVEQNPKKGQGIRFGDIRAAFRSGEENIEFEVIKYVGYDHNIATLLCKCD